MQISFQINYLEPKEIFLKDLNDDYLKTYDKEKKNQSILVAGTCTKINRANDYLTVFLLEDPTLGHIVEVFTDKIPYGIEIEVGMKIKLKGFYTKNKFNEKIIRVYRMQKINLNELNLFYLQIIANRKNKFDEQKYLMLKSEQCNDVYVGRNIQQQDGVKKIFSALFVYFFRNYKQIEKQSSFVFKDELLQIDEVKQLKEQVKEDQDFESFFNQALKQFQQNNLQTPFEQQQGYVINTQFFENLQSQFYNVLEENIKNRPDKVFQNNKVKYILNSLLEQNNSQLINKEATLQFIYDQILQKKMYYKDKKNQNLTLFK